MIVKIKFCGFRFLEDVEEAIRLGVDFIGFVLYPKSKRYISLEEVKEIVSKVQGKSNFVAVLVNEDINRLEEIWRTGIFSYLQLHGDEPPETVEKLKSKGINVIKAIRLGDVEDLKLIDLYKDTADYILLDRKAEVGYGGTGISIPEIVLDNIKDFSKIFISGGLTPENVKKIVEKYRPFGVDVSSGIELYPGKKDPQKMWKFLSSLKS